MELELADFHLPHGHRQRPDPRAGAGAAPRHHAASSRSIARLGQIRGDERKIKQVLLNLLSNAIKFTPEGGRIEVRARRDATASWRCRSATPGVGIAPEDQEAVFEEFRQVGTAEKKAEGTGLGLALCPEVHRAARRADLGQEPGGRGLDVHVHAPGAPWRMS